MLLLVLAGCGPAEEGEACAADADCAESLVCLEGEDSVEGTCQPDDCADAWTGYGCADTGA